MKLLTRFLLIFALVLSTSVNAATLLPPGEQTFLDNNGVPISGGTVTFYIPNTTSFKDTWRDPGQSILNANPVVLNSSGRAIIYGSGAYRQIVKDSLGNVIWDRPTADTSSSLTSWAGVSSGSANAQTVTATNFTSSDGQIISFIAGFSNSGATTLNPNGSGPISVVKDTALGSVVLTGGEIVAGNAVQVVYDTTAGILHLVSYPFPDTITPTSVVTASLTTTGTLLLTGIITPTALAVDTNNYSPTGFSTATVVRISASPTVSVTGLAARSSGTVVNLQNVGSTNITLTANDASSSAANRFLFPTAVELRPAESLLIYYDITATGWRTMHPRNVSPVAAGFKNLVVTATSATQVTITADAITLEDTLGSAYRAIPVSLTATISSSGANGLDTGAEASNTWYSVWAIYNPSTNTKASLLSTSATAPTMPTGYTYKARIGWVRNDGSSNFYRTIQYGRTAQYIVGTNPTTTLAIVSGASGNVTTPTYTAFSVSTFVPSTASAIRVTLAGNPVTAGMAAVVAPNASYGAVGNTANAAPLATVSTGGAANTGDYTATIILESTNIYYAANSGATALTAVGWEDNL